jgi:hypothetical protein
LTNNILLGQPKTAKSKAPLEDLLDFIKPSIKERGPIGPTILQINSRKSPQNEEEMSRKIYFHEFRQKKQ